MSTMPVPEEFTALKPPANYAFSFPSKNSRVFRKLLKTAHDMENGAISHRRWTSLRDKVNPGAEIKLSKRKHAVIRPEFALHLRYLSYLKREYDELEEQKMEVDTTEVEKDKNKRNFSDLSPLKNPLQSLKKFLSPLPRDTRPSPKRNRSLRCHHALNRPQNQRCQNELKHPQNQHCQPKPTKPNHNLQLSQL